MPHLFEQQPRESLKAFVAFQQYLALGPQRTIKQLARVRGGNVFTIRYWCRKFNWPARCSAHAGHLATVERLAQEKALRSKSAQWLARQDDLKEREFATGEECIAAGKKALAAFMARKAVRTNLSDIARILEAGSKLCRIASGLATTVVSHSGPDGGPIRVEFDVALKKIYGPEAGTTIEVLPETIEKLNAPPPPPPPAASRALLPPGGSPAPASGSERLPQAVRGAQ